MLAYGEGSAQIKLRHMRLAAKDTLETQGTQRPRIDFWLPSFGKWIFASLGMALIAFTIQYASALEQLW